MIICYFVESRVKLMLVLMVMKNRFRRSLWKGLMFDFSLWWYLLLVRMILVMKVFRVGERLIRFISNVMLIIIIRVVVVNSLCICEWVMNWKSGWVRKLLVNIMNVMVFSVISVVCYLGRCVIRLSEELWLLLL